MNNYLYPLLFVFTKILLNLFTLDLFLAHMISALLYVLSFYLIRNFIFAFNCLWLDLVLLLLHKKRIYLMTLLCF